ncbi:5'-methylthioadenosine/S-adenosylhomocysteine nucleosidase family protein [Flavobacterium selenitireducens]|uniref:5'-methylthioadenosine/S-adenosylhomocysteine nucleosidase family protein n=1 Tax=Flavobacterium selenitireducens TaxID=2722704 RepID=UPI00168B3123|nr:hypothetical protein [Flavobacterium selenitireducens]MBD3583599.1 5'-methylthioadenosine/S-adenosylhomocysteine nucleosidase [Flavobacterium selenitireducens]
MIDILILDDSDEKISLIEKYLLEECNIPQTNIFKEKNIKDGRKILYDRDFDLLLLDLVMPRDHETEPNAEESVKFLDEIYYNSSIHIPAHIIGFSQFDDLINAHQETFDDKLWHLINFSFTQNSWKDKLKSKVCYITSLKQRFKEAIESKNYYDIGIICALETPEFSEILQLDLPWKKISFEGDPLVYYSSEINTLNGNKHKIIACSITRMGMQASASVTTKIIEKFCPKYIAMTGICAGVKDRDINYGDIIVSENITDFGSGKMVETDAGDVVLKPEPHQIPTDQTLISKLSNFIRENDEIVKIQSKYRGSKPSTVLQAKIAPTTSGSYVVSSEGLVQSIIAQNRKLSAIDMEGYGVYLACHFFNKTKPLVVKSVCDFGDKHKGDDYQQYASYTSANFLLSFIKNML